VAGKLLRDGLNEEISARGALPFWRRAEDKGALALRITRRGLAAIGVARDSALMEAAESSGAGQGADPARGRPARRTTAARRKKTRNETPRLAAKPRRSDSKLSPCARDAPTQTWRDHRDGAGKTKTRLPFSLASFETRDDERIQVIEGLPRFGAKQKELAEKTSRDVADVPRYQPNTR
jgi:hypothetical protein